MARRVTFGGVEVFRIPNRKDAEHEVPDWVLYADDEDGADADDEADGADIADVYEDSDDGERAADSLREQAANVAARASRNRHITSYNPIGVDRSYGGDDERQHLGRAALPLRPMKKAPPSEEPEGGV